MLSFWEKKHLISFDIIIIGSGICGLSTACSIKEKNPLLSVAIIERGILPSGASTKNAGFACIGNPTEDLSDLAIMGENALIELVSRRYEGLSILRNRLGDKNISYEATGSYEVIFHHQQFENSDIDKLNSLLQVLFKQDVFEKLHDEHHYFGFSKKHVQSIFKNNMDGMIDTGKMMNHFLNYANSLGIRIFTGTSVESIEDANDKLIINTKSDFQNIAFKASKIALCTNAFSAKFLPQIDLHAGRGQVLITSEISNLSIKGTYSFDEGYYYFRNVGNRVLFGGGRNLDFEGETTTEFALNQLIQNDLINHLRNWIIPNCNFTIEQQWAGIMAFGGNKMPYVKKISDKMVAGVRMNGMGIALSGKIGEELADMLLV